MSHTTYKKKRKTIPTMSKIYFGIAGLIALWLILDYFGIL